MEATQSMFEAPTTSGMQRSLPLPKPTRPRQALTEKYRPRKLDELIGQPGAAAWLRSFASNPYPAAVLMSGYTGTGKTSAAQRARG